jgi:hypothetical protein
MTRSRAGGNAGSEEPVSKKGKEEVESTVKSTSRHIALGKPLRKPTAKSMARRAGAQKKKIADRSKYSFEIANCDMGSPAFMEALRATEHSVPWGVGSRGWPIEIDIEQFGSLCAGPDSVGAMILDLHRKLSAPPRIVNLADDESYEEALKIPSKVVMPSIITSRGLSRWHQRRFKTFPNG